MPGGRPTKYEQKFCQTIIEVGKEGGSLMEMATACGVLRETLHEWAKVNPEFSEAIKEALAHAQSWWEREGRTATFGGKPGFQATSYIFNMKNRFPGDWREKQEVEHSGGVEVTKIERVIVDSKQE